MKKYFVFLAAMMLVVTLAVTDTYAQGGKGKGKMGGNRGANFVDANGDGICDNNTTGKTCTGMGNQGKSKGANFIDANGDGVCDNKAAGKTGAGMRNQGKNKPNFIDADGDGVCDKAQPTKIIK